MKKVTKHNTRSNVHNTEQLERTYSYDDVFGKAARTASFRRVYDEERTRLTIAKEIRENRVAQKLTQAAVARKAGMSQSVIARVEGGDHSFSFDTLARIATVLGKRVVLK